MKIKDLTKILLSEEFIKEFISAINKCERIKHNKMIYQLFTPLYIQLWHKAIGKKPYLDFNYKPKL